MPILKHCMPNEMPIIAIQKTKPVIKYSNTAKKPPQKSHIKLPIVFICIFFVYFPFVRWNSPQKISSAADIIHQKFLWLISCFKNKTFLLS